MPTIFIENKTVSHSDIQNCLDVFQKVQKFGELDKQVIIHAKAKIEAIDPLLITYFILFKYQIRDLQITLLLPFNPIDNDNSQIEYQLKQIGTYAYLMTGMSIFQIVFGKLSVSFDILNAASFPDPRWFVFTSDFFPILLVSEDNEQYNFLFNDSFKSILKRYDLDLNKLDKEVLWSKTSEALRDDYHDHLRKSSKPNERERSLLNLARMAFISSLAEAKVAHLFFKEYYGKTTFNARNKIQAGNLQNENAFKYYIEIESVFDELQNSSISHQFFFSTILATELLQDRRAGKDILNDETKKAFINKINSLWSFTKDLVSGIKELAKNIREHSKPSVGAISVRLFRTERWIQIKNLIEQEDNIFSRYKKYLSDNHFTESSSVIDINVVDIGEIGVVSTLIRNTELLLANINRGNYEIKNLIEEDISNLRSNKIGFKNLLNTSIQQLNQQSKRSIAHFGLLTLSKLVEHNNGLIVASSQGNNMSQNRESLCIPDLISNYSNPIKFGTNFNIVLPIHQNRIYTTHLPHKISLPSETSAKDIKGVEELFNYKKIQLTNLQKEFQYDTSTKYILEFTFDSCDLANRNAEENLWQKFTNELADKNISTGIKYILCLNFMKIKINESQLFRLLGKFELNFPAIPMIILNIPTECYQRLIQANGEFHQLNPKLDYWNENISMLIYSYQEIRNSKFFFCDVLWGKSRSDFAYINHFVSLSAPNSTSILNKNSHRMKALISKVMDVNPNTDMFFINKNNLLPFELLLESSAGYSLFEENTLVMLQNELNA
jgi:hypothetical protein